MPDMYLVVGFDNVYAMVTKYNPTQKDRAKILDDFVTAGSLNYEILYEGPDRMEARKALERISPIEQAIKTRGREWLNPGLGELLGDP